MGSTSLASKLGASFEGRLIERDHAEYEDSRRVWNGMVDRRPALIAQCAGSRDVVAAVGLARDEGLPLAVRGGGHNVSGNAVCDNGVVVDLRLMQQVKVDPGRRLARAGGGATWGVYDRHTQEHGLASPGGAISTTGIAGLTLGGGFGWLSRSYGLACDNLVSAEVVTAAGEVIAVSQDKRPDLLWGLRGGGGNFGVVTRLDYRLHPVGELYAGLTLCPRSRARDFFAMFAEWSADAPEQLSTMAAFLSTPDGDPVVGVFSVYLGAQADGERALAPLRAFGSPLVDDVGMKSYLEIQQAFDAGFPSGCRNYWKSGFMSDLSEAAIDVLLEQAAQAPSPRCLLAVEHMLGGAVARVSPDETAFATRDARFNLLILGMAEDAEQDEAIQHWARSSWQAVQPHTSGRVYVNYMDHDESERVREAYGSHHFARLAELKKRYDPGNLFRLNQNIPPAG